MQDASLLQQIADNFTLLFLFTSFVVAVAWAFWPGRGAEHRDSANIVFRNEDKPLVDSTEEQL